MVEAKITGVVTKVRPTNANYQIIDVSDDTLRLSCEVKKGKYVKGQQVTISGHLENLNTVSIVLKED